MFLLILPRTVDLKWKRSCIWIQKVVCENVGGVEKHIVKIMVCENDGRF